MLKKLLVAQPPVLPKLQGAKQHDDCAKNEMPVPKRASFRVTKGEWRRYQPQPECDLAGFLPALQADVFELRKTEHKRPNQNRIPNDGLIVLLLGKPRIMHTVEGFERLDRLVAPRTKERSRSARQSACRSNLPKSDES